MIEEPPLLTINRRFERPDPKLVAKFKGAQTGHVVDVLGGLGALSAAIKPVAGAPPVAVGMSCRSTVVIVVSLLLRCAPGWVGGDAAVRSPWSLSSITLSDEMARPAVTPAFPMPYPAWPSHGEISICLILKLDQGLIQTNGDQTL